MQGNFECYFQGKKKDLLELIKLSEPSEAGCFMLSQNWNFLGDEDWAAMNFGSTGVNVGLFDHYFENDSCLFSRWMPALEALEGFTVYDYDMAPGYKLYLYSPYQSREILHTDAKSVLRLAVSASEEAMGRKSVTKKDWDIFAHLVRDADLPQAADLDFTGSNPDFLVQGDVLVAYFGLEQEVCIPEGVRKIGNGAFQKNEKLKSVVLQPGLRSIRSSAFGDCKGLKEVRLPDGMYFIGNCAFWKCRNLKDLYIPESVDNISEYAFYECKKLTIHAPAGSYAAQYSVQNGIPLTTGGEC